jgi:hypothetical protein
MCILFFKIQVLDLCWLNDVGASLARLNRGTAQVVFRAYTSCTLGSSSVIYLCCPVFGHVHSTVSVRADVCEACITKAWPVSFGCNIHCIFIRITILDQIGGERVVRVQILYLMYFMTGSVHPF